MHMLSRKEILPVKFHGTSSSMKGLISLPRETNVIALKHLRQTNEMSASLKGVLTGGVISDIDCMYIHTYIHTYSQLHL